MNPLSLVTPNSPSKQPAMVTAGAVFPLETLFEQAANISKELKKDTTSGDKIIVSLKNSPDFFAGLVGCWLAGAVPVLLDPMVKKELATAAEMTAAKGVIWHGRDDVTLPPKLCELIPDGARVPVVDSPEWNENDVVLYLFTSGSTGIPTLVPKTLPQIQVEVGFITALFDQPKRVATLVPWCHIWGLLSSFFVPLASGGTCDLTAGVSALTVLKRAAEQKIDLVTAVPAYYQAMVKLLEAKAAPKPAPTCRFACSSAPLSPELRQAFTDLSGCPITDIYGSTEAGGIAFRRKDGPWTPQPHVEMRIDDNGFLDVRSPSVSFETPDGFFSSGDMVRKEKDGFFLVGRSDDVVKIGGRRIALGEVQTVVEACPQVLRAAVLAESVRGALRLTAYVEPAAEEADAEGIKRFVRDKIADHKVPRVVHLIEKLPMTSSGKIDRRALKRIAEKEAH